MMEPQSTKAKEEPGFSSDFCLKDKRPLGYRTEDKFAGRCRGGEKLKATGKVNSESKEKDPQ